MRDVAVSLLPWLVVGLYLLVMGAICIYGLHRWWLLWTLSRSDTSKAFESPAMDVWPMVTVQLPMFNESAVAERIIEAAAGLDYPSDRLEIQVLDDSTDGCAQLAASCCDRLRALGHDVRYLHRESREGFKAGALEAGLGTARGEFVAIFDADFVPPADLLKRMLHPLADKKVGMVQARWSHLNRDESLLTRTQALFLDGHFVVEQAARARSGRWFNFNGTAGIWRKACITDSGGWQHDTLTEDTDLSYRAQLRGWKCAFLPDVLCPAELPPTVGAMLSQQHRWNKGLIQTAMKLLPTLLRSNAPIGHKIEAWFHLTSPVVHVLMLSLVVLAAAAAAIPIRLPWMSAWEWMTVGVVFLGLGTVAASCFYLDSQRRQGRSVLATLPMLPVLMAIGVGMSVTNTRAVLGALSGVNSPFIRTPKFNGAKRGDLDPAVRLRRWRVPVGIAEISVGLLVLAAITALLGRPNALVGIPFLALFAVGYLGVGFGALARR